MHSALLSLDTANAVSLVLISIAAGVGISAVGPGGVLMTIGLFGFTSLSPSGVAGTAIVTHVGTGLVGTIAYWRSGQLQDHATRRTAMILCAATFAGIPIGTVINVHLSRDGFGLLLGAFAAAIGVLVGYRQRRRATVERANADGAVPALRDSVTALIGIFAGAASALFGIGGPMVSVPLLVVVGMPILPALAVAQVQSVVGSGFGAIGYASQGSIDWFLAIFVADPQMIGVVAGWKLAHAIPARGLAFALAFVLIGLAPYLAFGSS